MYYFNTYDGQGELDTDKMTADVQEPVAETNGYHIEDEEAQIMEALEIEILSNYNIKSPY